MVALRGLPRLRCLRITSNAAAVDWRMCLQRAPRALPALQELSLDYRRAPLVQQDGNLFDWEHSCVSPVTITEPALSALRAASCLTALTLRAVWDDKASTLLRALPALADIR
jgi:hypothetical protein